MIHSLISLSLVVPAERFRVQHPRIPEPYYGRLAKTVESSSAYLVSPDAPAAPVDPGAAYLSVPVETAPEEEPIPKLSLRRDSLPGAPWVTVERSNKKAQTNEIVVSIEFSPLRTVELTTYWYQLHNGDYG